MNISQWIEFCSQEMERAGLHYGHGTDNAHDEAVWLVLHSLGAALDGSFDGWQQPVSQAQADQIKALLHDRVSSGKPLAYLLGSAWFAGLEFLVSDQVLVPRSPIAELIAEQFTPWLNPSDIDRILDLCTGSGCIAIACAVHLPQAQVDATDISSEALQVARQNVQRHAVTDRVRLIQSDLFEALDGERYKLIVTNPPYVADSARGELPAEYHSEPGLGLYSGHDGLDLCLLILLQAADYLDDGGVLICEVGESADRLSAALPDIPFLWLEFYSGGDGVFLLGKDMLERAKSPVSALIKERNCVG